MKSFNEHFVKLLINGDGEPDLILMIYNIHLIGLHRCDKISLNYKGTVTSCSAYTNRTVITESFNASIL